MKDYFSCGNYIFEDGIKILKETNVNYLILHSKDDHIVKYYTNTYLLTEYVKKDNVKFIIVNDKKHNPDYCKDAIEYTDEVFYKLGQIESDEEKLEYRKSLNYQLMGQLDTDIMEQIVEYLKGV